MPDGTGQGSLGNSNLLSGMSRRKTSIELATLEIGPNGTARPLDTTIGAPNRARRVRGRWPDNPMAQAVNSLAKMVLPLFECHQRINLLAMC